MKPLVSWVGGKARLAPDICGHIPLVMTEYHEPFAGAAAVFCELHNGGDLDTCGHVSLGDANVDLINLYRTVQDPGQIEAFIAQLLYYSRKYKHPARDPERLYYDERDLWNAGERTASRFVLLKQTSFNGLWRVNKAGGLNASWGKKKDPGILDEANIREWHAALQTIDVRHADFAVLRPGPGAVVYVDPPYYGLFNGYTADGFNHADHVKLLCEIWKWRNAGAFVLYSNTFVDAVSGLLKLLWPEADLVELTTKYVINTDGSGRTDVLELLAVGG